MNIAIIILVTLAASDYTVITGNFSDINDNFNLV